ADGEFRGAKLQREECRGHPAADEAQMAEDVERYEVGDFHAGVHTAMATPTQVTAMPASASVPGHTPKNASSSTTAKIGGRYIMLVTRVASPWRMRRCRALTPRSEVNMTRNTIAPKRAPLQRTLKPSTPTASGARPRRGAANWTTPAALRSACGENVR